jgi:hypothetical protein
LRSVSEKLRRAVVFFCSPVVVRGSELNEPQGTGFVISKARRLVATAAHVADASAVCKEPVYGILDGTSHRYRVERVWYHPGLMRVIDPGLAVRSSDPMDGEPGIGGPDVAVVQLSLDGPELPVEMQLADKAEWRSLEGQAVACLGYPVSVSDRLPSASRQPSALFTCARIGKPDLPSYDPVWATWMRSPGILFYKLEFGPGASGAPLLLPNGRVVGLVTGGEPSASANGMNRDYGHRADCVLELVGYHGIDPDKWKPLPQSAAPTDWGPDPNLERFRKAARLARESLEPLLARDYRFAIQKCDEALSLVPDYAGALYRRSKIYAFYLHLQWNVLNPEPRLAFAVAARRDASRSADLCAWPNDTQLYYCQAMILEARARSAPRTCARALERLDALSKRGWPYEPLSDADRAYLFNLRAQAHEFLGKLKEAESDYGESIRFEPDEGGSYLMRASLRQQMGRLDLAEEDRTKAEELGAVRDKRAAKPVSEPESLIPEVPGANGGTVDLDKSKGDVRPSAN